MILSLNKKDKVLYITKYKTNKKEKRKERENILKISKRFGFFYMNDM